MKIPLSVLVARENQRSLTARFEDINPCPQCGAVDPDYRKTCIHRNDDRFGSPRCDDGLPVSPQVGQIWMARPEGSTHKFSWKRYVRIESIDKENDRVTVRTVQRLPNGTWTEKSRGRLTTPRLSRFNGGYHTYGFVESP